MNMKIDKYEKIGVDKYRLFLSNGEVIDTYDKKKIIDSLTKFSNKINKFFNKENPELIENKISELNVCININNYAIYGTILMFIVIPSFYLKNLLKEKLSLKTYNDYLKNRNYI